MKKVKLKYLEKIYKDVHFIQTSSVILQNKIDDKKLIGTLFVNYEQGSAVFDCKNYHLVFECSNISVIFHKSKSFLLITVTDIPGTYDFVVLNPDEF